MDRDVLAEERPERRLAKLLVKLLQEACAAPVDRPVIQSVGAAGRVVRQARVDVAGPGPTDHVAMHQRRQVRSDVLVVRVDQVPARTPRPATDRRSRRCQPANKTTDGRSRAAPGDRGCCPPPATRRPAATASRSPGTPSRRSSAAGPCPRSPARIRVRPKLLAEPADEFGAPVEVDRRPIGSERRGRECRAAGRALRTT